MKTKAFIYVIIAGIAWGTSGIFVNLLAPYGYTSLQMTALRGIVCFLCLSIYLLIKNRALFRANPKQLLLYFSIGASLFGTASCYFTSMQMTSIATAVVLMYTAPILVMIFSVAFLGEKLTGLKAISVVCMLVGCCLVSGIVGGLKFNVGGILLGLISGICYSAYNILTKVAMQKGCHPMTTTVYNAMFMGLIALCVCKPIGIVTQAAQKPMLLVPLMIALGVVTFVLPYFLYTLAMRDLPAGTASALSIVEPMSATVFSVVLFHEAMGVLSVIGVVLILLAVFLLSRDEA
jgi:drug/metabolite transporter (DMT)-like permease